MIYFKKEVKMEGILLKGLCFVFADSSVLVDFALFALDGKGGELKAGCGQKKRRNLRLEVFRLFVLAKFLACVPEFFEFIELAGIGCHKVYDDRTEVNQVPIVAI